MSLSDSPITLHPIAYLIKGNDTEILGTNIMSAILSWFGIGKAEKFMNVKTANDEIIRLRSMLANIPSSGVSSENYLAVKEAFSKLKDDNEKLITLNQELIADVHLATEANKTEMTNLKSALEVEKQSLRNSQNELTEEKSKLNMAINRKAAELIASFGITDLSKLPPVLSTQDLERTDGVKFIRHQ